MSDPIYAEIRRQRALEGESAQELAFTKFRLFLIENRELLLTVARQGDGQGGPLIEIMREELRLGPDLRGGPISPAYRKSPIPARLRTEVFERDHYRCLRCGTHRQLRADHVIPEVNGGAAELGNLQTLCAPCNSWKGVRAIDFRAKGAETA